MSMVTYPVRLERWVRPAARVFPECKGKGFTTIEIREAVTLYDTEWPVTVPVTCYKTRPCWRCHGARMVREER